MRRIGFLVVIVFLASIFSAAPSSASVGFNDPLKPQSETDASNTNPNASPNDGGWGDLAGGANDRPYISKLSYTNGENTVNITPPEGTTDPLYFTTHQLENNDITAVVSPVNLCRAGVSPSPGKCYATPNRVSVGIGFVYNGSVHRDFSQNSGTGQASEITADTVFDMTVNLNTIGSQLRWSQLYGDLRYWKTTNLGAGDATVQVKFSPAIQPEIIGDYNTYRGCYTIPQRSCPISHPTANFLEASLLLSLEAGYGESLTGSVFSVTNAMYGEICDGTFQPADANSVAPYCRKDASPLNPVMEFQMAGMHWLTPTHDDDNLTKASMKAFIPEGTLLNVYGITPQDATTTFSVTRTTATNVGETSKNDPPTFTAWNADEHGSNGLLVSVTGVTFSTPKYKIVRKLVKLTSSAKQSGKSSLVSAKYKCSSKSACVVSVFKLSKVRYLSTTTLLSSKTTKTPNPSLSIPTTKLKKGDRYLITLRSTSGKLLTSTSGTVS